MTDNWSLDHIGIAVENIDEAIETFQTIGGSNQGDTEPLEYRDMKLAFVAGKHGSVELLSSERENSVIRKFLDNNGPGLHHVALRVEDIDAEVRRLKKEGYEFVEPAPRSGSHDTTVAFIHPRSADGVLVELVER